MPVSKTSSAEAFDRLARPIDRAARGLFLLFRHPGFYARDVSPRLGWLWLVVMTLTFGLEFAISGLGKDALREKPVFAPADWTEWWLWALGLSVFSGILVASLGDVFFRLRLALAGAPWPESKKVTRAYLSIAQIGALPAIAVRLGETAFYATPDEADIGVVGLLFAIVFVVWEQVGEYRATVDSFGAPPLRARLVFLWLPVGLVVLALAALELFK